MGRHKLRSALRQDIFGKGQGAAAGTVLLDEFDGSALLADHTPDVAPDGATWNVIRGVFGACADGYAHGADGPILPLALIDCGLTDFDLTWTQIVYFNEDYGIAWRYAADGSGGHQLFVEGGAGKCFTSGGSVIRTVTYITPISFVNAREYTFLLRVRGRHAHLYVDGALWMDFSECESAPGACHVGLFGYHSTPYMAWGRVQVDSFPVEIERRIVVLGDSENLPPSLWPYQNSYPYRVATQKATGLDTFYHIAANHAVGGAKVADWLANQVPAAAGDEADIILILVGCLDRLNVEIAADYEAGLLQLGASNPDAVIFCLGILDTTRSDILVARPTLNANIQAACALAMAEGVNVQYVNTDGWIDPGPPEWQPSTAYAVGDEVWPSGYTWGYQITFRAIAAGTSGPTAPAWPTTLGETVVDGGVTWQAQGNGYDTIDGLHPNVSGHSKIAAVLLPLLP